MTQEELKGKNNMALMKDFFNDPPLKLMELKELSKKDRDELSSLVRRHYKSIATD
ncbi:MAG: hypothetical protein ACFE9S_07530 [Candidatus Hermodarchaeota archaeon]